MEMLGIPRILFPHESMISMRFSLYPPITPVIPRKTKISKTVIVSGLPLMMTGDDIKQVFKQCGPITQVWRNALSLCCIEFVEKSYASNAVSLTGYNIYIEKDIKFNGKLLINYASFKEIKNKPYIPFSKETCIDVAAKIANKDTILEGIVILTDWLKKGQGNGANSEDILFLLEVASLFANDLVKEKVIIQDAIRNAKTKFNATASGITNPSKLLSFNLAPSQANFDSLLGNLPERERQNIMMLMEEFEESSNDMSGNLNEKRNNQDMCSSKKRSRSVSPLRKELSRLKQEKEELESQLGEVNVRLANEEFDHEQEVNALKQMLIDARKRCEEYEAQLADQRAVDAKRRNQEVDEASESEEDDSLSNLEARIITELSSYLKEISGATLSAISAYLQHKDFHITEKTLAQLMRRFPALFRADKQGSGSEFEVKWVFIDSDEC